MRQSIDFAHVDVCIHVERSTALLCYPVGDDVSTLSAAKRRIATAPKEHGAYEPAVETRCGLLICG